MADFAAEIVDSVLAACQAGAQETAEALSRALDAELQFTPSQAANLDLDALPDGLDGPGLVVVLTVGEAAALVLLPESSGLIPAWYADPDPTGKSKLMTLAQELGMLLLPEEFMPDDFQAARVPHLGEALRRGEVATGAGLVSLDIAGDNGQGVANLVWPAIKPGNVFSAAEMEGAPRDDQANESPAPDPAESPPTRPDGGRGKGRPHAPPGHVKSLPGYVRSLLKIRVPVTVTLASKRQPISEVVELGPGSIIQFEKACHEALELEIANRPVAVGEPVKVGDKFGLRITSMIMPQERFSAIVHRKVPGEPEA